MIDLLTSFPTSIFTGFLVFCLAWWLITLLVAGLDADADLDVDGDGLGEALGFSSVPLPLALTLLGFGAWSMSLVLQLVLRTDDTGAVAVGSAVAIIAAALVVGLGFLKLMSKPLGRLFHTEHAPTRASTVGATCKVRTLTVTTGFGDAEVTTGPTRGSVVKVRAADGRFVRGDLAHIIDYDEATEAFIIDDLDESLC
jgi:hypothetical protein